MKYLILAFKGFIIGLAKILPGVSGAILSISLGVYERLITIIGNPLKISFDDFKFLFSLMFGAFLGIALLCDGVMWCLDKWKFATMMFFIGLIIGGSTDIINDLKNHYSVKNVFIMILSILFSIIITNLGNNNSSGNYYFLMGFIESLTTIIPGISGTAIFMSLGWYENLLTTIKNILTFSAPFFISFKFILGYLISTIIIAKVLDFLFKRYKNETYFSIFGFLLSSVFSMFITIISYNFSFLDFLLGALLLVTGYYLTKTINYFFSNL